MRKLRRGLLVSFLALVLLIGGSLIFWISTSHSASSEAQQALKKADTDNYSWYAFGANEYPTPTVGVVLYPGAHVSADAYALLAQQLAKESGVLVVVTRVPLDLAFLDRDAAREVVEAYPNVKRWIVGGHSLGGAVAANFAENNPDEVYGLLLWASRPPMDTDLSEKNLEVTSIYGSQDRLIDSTSIAEAQTRLPASTVYVEIEGANHGYFSDYGEQSGDGEPTISRDEARAEILRASSNLIEQVQSTTG
jgi:dienelactone hydrolase